MTTLPSWWSGVGGPSLIVVFIAVGVLAVLIGILILLRGLRVAPASRPATMSRLKKRKIGEKPNIFDLPIAYEQGRLGRENVANWDDIIVSTKLLISPRF
jgi:hypothetical protein